MDFRNKWVLVTGASSGLGYAMARQLAYRHGANLILSARREKRLLSLQEELEKEAKVQVKIHAADLSLPEEVSGLLRMAIEQQDLYAAILNAGITFFGKHLSLSEQAFETLLQINVKSVVQLCSGLVEHFEASGKPGGLLFVSSMAGLFPAPYQAVYSGTKAFVLGFVSALALELTNKKLSLTVFAPGGIATEMTAGEHFGELKRWLMPVEQAAKEGIFALKTRQFVYIPGRMNRWGCRLLSVLPRKFLAAQLAKRYLSSLNSAVKTP